MNQKSEMDQVRDIISAHSHPIVICGNNPAARRWLADNNITSAFIVPDESKLEMLRIGNLAMGSTALCVIRLSDDGEFLDARMEIEKIEEAGE